MNPRALSESRKTALPDGTILVKVTPRASREKIEAREGTVRVYVCAAPTDNEANEAVVKCIAKALGVPKSSVSIVRGHKSREKAVQVVGLDEATALSRLTG